MTPRIRRFTMYVTDETYEALEKEALKRKLSSVQNLIRVLVGETLGIKSKIKTFQSDVLCPECGSNGEIVEDIEGKRCCLNCGYSKKIGLN